MLKKIMMASLAVGALALGAPAAHAEHATYDCGFETLSQETATGGQDTYTGVAYGFVASANEAVSIRCFVQVDGSDQGGTPTGSDTSLATTQGSVTFTASDQQDVKLCAEWSAGAESGTECFETTNTQIPPQPVIDLIDQIGQIIADATAGLDPIICGALQTAGVPAALNSVSAVTTITLDEDDCDIYLGGELLIDFVPYGA